MNSKEEYLSIRAIEDTTIKVFTAGTSGKLFAQINNGGWEENILDVTIGLSAGDVIRYKGSIKETHTSLAAERGVMFSISNKVELFGDCTSIFEKRKLFECALSYAFERAPILRVSADFLPSTTLERCCYQHMFYNCTSLTAAPELPATTLVDRCYNGMFQGCSSLNYIKAMFTTTPGLGYTGQWVDGVASSGTFVKNRNATWDVTGVDGIPSGWTVQTA